jgi:hypothetical protein
MIDTETDRLARIKESLDRISFLLNTLNKEEDTVVNKQCHLRLVKDSE